jgi:hypothetical protein
MDNPIKTAKGVNGQLLLYKNRVRIERKGVLSFLTQGLKGQKDVFIKQISSIQFKPAGLLTNGYIQFAFLGGTENKGGLFNATQDENTIMFNKGQQKVFEEIKEMLNNQL